jgi:DNA-binding transcriptional ArsR family regulator
MTRDRHYADLADKEEGRDHRVTDKYRDTIVVSEGAFGRAWLKFNPGVPLVYVDDAEGHPRALTPKQYMVLVAALEMIDGIGITMRALAAQLEVAPSTVSRALTKLAAWGLIGYVCGRGRWAGLVIFRRAKDDGLDRFRQAAKARVRRWSEAAQRRISRLWINVAPYALDERGYHNPYYFNIVTSSTYKSATLTAQPFSVEELRDAGII